MQSKTDIVGYVAVPSGLDAARQCVGIDPVVTIISGLAGGVEGLPGDAFRVGDPGLVGNSVTALGVLLFDGLFLRRLQAPGTAGMPPLI